MDLNNTIKNTVSVGNFEREMKLYNSELTQMIDHNNTQFKNQLTIVTQEKLNKTEFKDVIKD